MIRRSALALLIVCCAAAPARGVTARDLGARIHVDGRTTDFTDDEKLFGLNPDGSPQEASDDSKWGVNDDIAQIRITWDAKYLYVAGEGRIWGNNMILFIDSVPGRGLARMDSLNSWRRNFFFDAQDSAGFAPDLFGATWDQNTTPRLITQMRGQNVEDDIVGPLFTAAATFDQGNTDRAMEMRIPWRTVFLAQAGLGTHDTLITVGGVTDTIPLIPRGARLRICGVVTGGGDGTGGPDSAPDNTRGLTSDAGVRAVIDNYASVELDRNDDTGLGGGGPDGVADWGVQPITRVSFRYPPPILPRSFCARELSLDRPVLLPDLGESARFRFTLDPPPDPGDPNNTARTVSVSAYVYDLAGRLVRVLYVNDSRRVLDPATSAAGIRDAWDGRDRNGAIVLPGVYVVRVVTEPGVCRALRSVVVAR